LYHHHAKKCQRVYTISLPGCLVAVSAGCTLANAAIIGELVVCNLTEYSTYHLAASRSLFTVPSGISQAFSFLSIISISLFISETDFIPGKCISKNL
jgi:ABC-type spermidine/putrescine transport system permease subunit II